jgi:signal transduction histidine kinase
MVLRYPVAALRHDPLGMFFYNQRALVFGAAFLFLVAISAVSIVEPPLPAEQQLIFVLWFAWFCAVSITLLLQPSFRRILDSWIASRTPSQLPPIFERYFVLDAAVLAAVVVAGRAMSLPVNAFAYLLIATAVGYAVYAFGRTDISRRRVITLGVLTAVSLLNVPSASRVPLSSGWVGLGLHTVPLAAMIAIAILSVSVVAWLRRREQQDVTERLKALGSYAETLATTLSDAEHGGRTPFDRLFRRQVHHVLADLCDGRRERFWYRSACLWMLVEHRDRGQVLVPTVTVDVPEARDFRSGLDTASGRLHFEELEVVYSLNGRSAEDQKRWHFRVADDVPAAAVPLRRDKATVGLLILYGEESSAVPLHQEPAFLSALASLLGNAFDQWEARVDAEAVRDLDTLLSEPLDRAFAIATRVLQSHLHAGGCMIIFRRNPNDDEMTIVGAAGFSDAIQALHYTATIGQTGRCAATGSVIRVDDVTAHREMFDASLLVRLTRAHGREVTSWMAIPIGMPPYNYGVVKVVNSAGPYGWFTARDERLGVRLALRLHVAIELALHVSQMERIIAEERASAARAQNAMMHAERLAQQRQQDLMVIAHQLQGPLISVMGALSAINSRTLDSGSRELMEHADAIVEDAIVLTYGVFTGLAREAGRDTTFNPSPVNAALEIKRLAARLQRTNQRGDLRFAFQEEAGFPLLRVDRQAFAGVMYSLIHNAMKYADERSRVVLECSFEGADRHPALKVKTIGEPIAPQERLTIFEKFQRGASVDRGRLHSGVGLGLWVARSLMQSIGGDLTLELAPAHPRLSVFVAHWPTEAAE